MKNKFTIEEVRNFWDKVANKYEDSHKKISETHHQRFKEAIKYLDLNPGDKILNIWSRTGEAIPYFRQKCPQIELFNLEASNNFLAMAKEKFPKENFEKTDLDTLNFKNDYFDFVLSLETLEHTPDPKRFLAELYRVLKKGGILVMSLPPATAEVPQKIYHFLAKSHGEGPHKFLASKVVKKLLKETGFKLILHKGTLLIPIGPGFLRKFGEKMINSFQNTFLSEFGIRQFYVAKK